MAGFQRVENVSVTQQIHSDVEGLVRGVDESDDRFHSIVWFDNYLRRYHTSRHRFRTNGCLGPVATSDDQNDE